MVEVDTTYPSARARLTRAARRALEPLAEQIGRDVRARARGGLTPLLDREQWAGRYASALADIGGAVVADIGERVTVALGGEVSTRARIVSAGPVIEQPYNATGVWSPQGTTRYIAEVADAIANGELDVAGVMIAEAPAAERDAIIDHVMTLVVDSGTSMADVAANFAAQDAAERAGATKKRWQVNSTNPRPDHSSMSGETVPINERFSNGLRYPRSAGPPQETANCRCSMVIVKEDS